MSKPVWRWFRGYAKALHLAILLIMPLSWNEIKARAIVFSREWAVETRETAEAKSFWDDFFNVFGISRRAVAVFEEPVRSLKGTYNRIDLFWKGRLLAEHKSAGKNLERAKGQAFDYIQDLMREGRHAEVPRYVVTTDFAHIQLYDLEADVPTKQVADFPLKEFHRHIKHFAFIAGYKQHTFEEEPAVNLKAAELMARLHDTLADANYPDHQRQVFLVRLLFCLFANDTGIFDSKAFDLLIEESKSDGQALGRQLAEFFDILNTPPDQRQTTLDEILAGLPYVNGGLFTEHLTVAHFNTAMREALLDASRFDWSRISPAVFGSLFQGVMEKRERRQIGAHYTSEANILKVIRPLFLDDLQEQLKKAGTNHAALNRLHDHLADLKLLDPACGCGNFLVIAYREIRAIENELLVALYRGQTVTDISQIARVNVDQFYGIEIDEWPARIAEVAIWLMDHLMNRDLSEKLGQYFARLPLLKTAHILHANALRTDWADLLPPSECSFIMGNPPFIGHHFQNDQQKADQHHIMSEIPTCGTLDFVCNWYVKAAEYSKEARIPVAFVSTNSISQGEQVAGLWGKLFQMGAKIHFAHRTFKWESEARGKAHVHVVIIGWGLFDVPNKRLFDHDGEGVLITTPKNISPYLFDGPDLIIAARSVPICPIPKMSWGNKPTDGGHFLLSEEDRADLVSNEPAAEKWIRQYMGGQDFLHNKIRYCLWLINITPTELRSSPVLNSRIESVRDFRLASKAASTRAYAKYPTLFRQIAQPDSDYLAVPEVSSENREYIPMAMVSKNIIASNTVQFVPAATLYHFGVLTSTMHMAWMRQVAGRLKSDYRYSNTIVYNTFPWPEKVSDTHRSKIEQCAQAVLDERAKHQEKGATLADLYDPLTMPPGLAKAHAALDRAVDRAYRSAPFATERARVEHLFGLYQTLTTLFPVKKKTKSRKQ